MGAPRTPTGAFQLNIGLRHSAGDAAGSSVWALHVPGASTKKVVLRRFHCKIGFDGTALAAENYAYELIRASGIADPTTGTTVPRIKKNGSRQGNSVIADANVQQKSGILTFAPTFDSGGFHNFGIPGSITNGMLEVDLRWAALGDFQSDLPQPHVFYPDESWAIRLLAVAKAGLALHGSFEIDEIPI